MIAPKRPAELVWPHEAAVWRPDLSVAVAAGTPTKRARALASGADVVVIGRDNVGDLLPGQFPTVVLDELSGYKNRTTKRWKKTAKITQFAEQVWGLTGTPSPNGYMDLWAQVSLLDRGRRLESTLTKYRARYFRPGRQLPTGVVIEWKLVDGARDRIEEQISDICLSMRSVDHLDLPPVTSNVVELTLGADARRLYDEMREHLVARLDPDDTRVAANAAVATGKLSQITAGFLYPDVDGPAGAETVRLNTSKTEAVAEILEGTGSPVLAFYRFQAERDTLLGLDGARLATDPGAVDAWNRGEVPLLLAHPASAGHGLNLQHGGHTIVWVTMPWSSEEYSQANARLARQGQSHPVVIHHLVARDTIDEQILAVLQDKISAQTGLLVALQGGSLL